MSSTKSNSLFALADCNNFFVSCERVFNPKLIGYPVVVLSGNDGCVVARSEEAKALGVPMGAPAFEYKDLFYKNNVAIFSSNFSLYSEISKRVMSVLRESVESLAVYSIDEAFLHLNEPNPVEFCVQLRKKVMKWTGIPISIGIASTKTLAKVAAKRAKKGIGVEWLHSQGVVDALLDTLAVDDVWGIGRRTGNHLRRKGVHTAMQFKSQEDLWIRRLLGVTGLKTAYELRGISCFSIGEVQASQKSITVSRSFGQTVTKFEEVREALSLFTAKAAIRLRGENSLATALYAYVHNSPFAKDEPYYANTGGGLLPFPTDYTPDLLQAAGEALTSIFKEGYSYKKVGILLSDLVPKNAHQSTFFSSSLEVNDKKKTVMQLMDHLNDRQRKVFFASEGVTAKPKWKSNSDKCSGKFTSNWDEILTVS